MPITKSAKKSLRQSIKRRKRNLWRKKKIKELFKKITNLAKQKKLDEAKGLLHQYYQAIDKAVKTKVLKENTGRRKKSRLSIWLNQLEQSLSEKN